MNFGARVLKTGIAVTLALYASTLLKLPSPTIAAVAAVFAMQPTIYRSWRYFWDQIQTNTLGAVLAVLALYFFQNDPIAVGLVCILVIMICLKMKLEENIGLTLVTVIAIMEAPGGQLDFAFNRFSLSCIGIICAFLVNILLFPPNPQKQFFDQIRKVFAQMSLLIRTLISDEMKETIFQEEKKKLLSSIKSLNSKYQLYEEEQKKLKRPAQTLIRQLVVYKQMFVALTKGSEILETVEQHYFQSNRPTGTDSSFDIHLEKLIKHHEHVFLKFENKIKPAAYEDFAMDEENARFLQKMIRSVDTDSNADRLNDLAESALEGAQRNKPDPVSEELSSNSNKEGVLEVVGLRLVVVAAVIYDYGFQIGRLDKLVEQYLKGADGKPSSRLRKLTRRWLP